MLFMPNAWKLDRDFYHNGHTVQVPCCHVDDCHEDAALPHSLTGRWACWEHLKEGV